MLTIENLTKFFGGLQAVSQVDMTVNKNEILGLIGPNGAGKTTFFNLISGVLRPTSGRVVFQGKDITASSPHAIAKKGIVRTFQGDNVFPDFSVLDNVILSCHLKPGVNFFETVLRLPSSKRKDKEILNRSGQILRDRRFWPPVPDLGEKPRPRAQKNFRYRLCPRRGADPPSS